MDTRQMIRVGGLGFVLGLGAFATWQGMGAYARTEAPAVPVALTASPASAASPAVALPRASYADVVDRVTPGVVIVRTEGRTAVNNQMFDFGDLPNMFGQQFRGQNAPRVRRQQGTGSGVVVSQDGYILTNNHVVEQADSIRVESADKHVFTAKLIGTDAATDLAVIKIDAKALPVVTLGDSDRVRVGDVVLAVGNPLNLGQTVTMGIVSAKGRTTNVSDAGYEDFIQTDAPINQGNSGGALVNTDGELIGINSQILSPSGGNIGLGFAIPVNMARNVMDQLMNGGKVRRAKLGVTVQTMTADLASSLGLSQVKGALVSDVESGGAAARAGLRQGDVILEVAGHPVADSNELRNAIAGTKPGTAVALKVQRDGRVETMSATLGERTDAAVEPDGTPGAPTSSGAAFGLSVQALTPALAARLDLGRDARGVVVTAVEPDGAAAEAGVREGDLIRKVNGVEVTSSADLRAAFAKSADKPALILLTRQGQTIFLTLKK